MAEIDEQDEILFKIHELTILLAVFRKMKRYAIVMRGVLEKVEFS